MSQLSLLGDAMTCDPLDLIEQAGELMPERDRWPQRMTELFDIEFAYSRRQGMTEEQAAADASARVLLVADYLGGAVIYLPRGDALRRAVRDADAYQRHNGRNTEALARELGITVTKMYEVLAREKARRVAKRQGRLFEEE